MIHLLASALVCPFFLVTLLMKLAQLVIGLIGAVIACWLLFEPSNAAEDREAGKTDVAHFKTDAITALAVNVIVALLAFMGISVAASELPLAFRKRETLLGMFF